jgi:RNA polymerase sigma-70 factor, ECF subfamily
VNFPPSPDADWLAALQAGDRATFDALVDQMQRPLVAFAWRYLHNNADAEDVVIDTFVRLYLARARLRPDTNVNAWLFTTLANLCHNRHRWKRRHPESSLDTEPSYRASELVSSAVPPDIALDRNEASAALRAAVDALPHDLRTVVLLHHYEHLSYREIGLIVGCSDRGIETRLYRARHQLRNALAAFIEHRVAS